MKLLIVDDEKKIVDYLVNSLNWEKYGFSEIQAFTSSKEAILFLDEGHIPDLLITDIKMPEVSGIDLVQKIKGKSKVIIISGYSDFEYAQQAIRYGVFDYLLKPIFPDVLEKAIEKISKEISIHHLTQSIDSVHFYLALLADKLNEDSQMEQLFNRLIVDNYLPTVTSFGDKTLLEFSLPHHAFAFVFQDKQSIQNKPRLQKKFFEAVFQTTLSELSINDSWIKKEINEKNWNQLILTLEHPVFDAHTAENLLVKTRLVYYLYQADPRLFQQKTMEDLVKLITSKELVPFLYLHLDHTIRKIEDTKHSILFMQDYVKNNLSAPLSLELLAEKIHVHPVYLSKIYKQETGENLSQFILEQRLAKMKELLLTTELKIKTITELVGYRKPQNINEIFKKKFGYTPTQYRKIHQSF